MEDNLKLVPKLWKTIYILVPRLWLQPKNTVLPRAGPVVVPGRPDQRVEERLLRGQRGEVRLVALGRAVLQLVLRRVHRLAVREVRAIVRLRQEALDQLDASLDIHLRDGSRPALALHPPRHCAKMATDISRWLSLSLSLSMRKDYWSERIIQTSGLYWATWKDDCRERIIQTKRLLSTLKGLLNRKDYHNFGTSF